MDGLKEARIQEEMMLPQDFESEMSVNGECCLMSQCVRPGSVVIEKSVCPKQGEKFNWFNCV